MSLAGFLKENHVPIIYEFIYAPGWFFKRKPCILFLKNGFSVYNERTCIPCNCFHILLRDRRATAGVPCHYSF